MSNYFSLSLSYLTKPCFKGLQQGRVEEGWGQPHLMGSNIPKGGVMAEKAFFLGPACQHSLANRTHNMPLLPDGWINVIREKQSLKYFKPRAMCRYHKGRSWGTQNCLWSIIPKFKTAYHYHGK